MDDLNNIYCKRGISLEPRLQEYLKKKKFYKNYNSNPSVPLEKEFMITNEDKRRIKAFLNGDDDLYDSDKVEKYIDPPNDELLNQMFPSNELKNDPRFDRQRLKMERDNEAMKMRHNYSNYTFDSPNLIQNNDGMYMKQPTKLKTQPKHKQYINASRLEEDPIDRMIELQEEKEKDIFSEPTFLDSRGFDYENKYSLHYKDNDPRTYNHPPKTQNNVRQPYTQYDCAYKLPHDNNLNNIIGKLDTYTKHTNTIYQHSAEMDTENKMSIPCVNSNNKKYINTADYKSVPYMGKNGELRNVDYETYLKNPFPTRSARSFGHNTTAEHSFQYISNDLQSADHTVMPFPRGGENTRTNNHATSRPTYTREILN
jgi:hypothetical protein